MTRTTRAAVFISPGTPLEIREFPLPEPRGREVLVEVIACTLCGSDLHSLRGRRSVPVPTILGHETLGRIAEFGPGSSRLDASGRLLRVGDRVTWSIVANCGECFYCRRLLPQKCERPTKYGHEPLRPGRELTGGLAEHCLLAEGSAIFLVPEGLSDATACPANCAGGTVAAALELAGPLDGGRVLMMGSGMLGVTATAWARALGAEQVIASDISTHRLELARSFGATDLALPDALAGTVFDRTDGYGVDAAFEMTGDPQALEALVPLIRMGGSLILVGSVFPSRPVNLLAEQVVRRCLTIRGIHNYAPRHLRAALDFLGESPQFSFDRLVTAWEPLEAVEQALATPLPAGKLRLGIRPRG